MQQQTVVQTRSIVCIAAPQDASLLASWENHLLPLQQAKLLSFWSERALLPGEDRFQQLLTHLDQAEVIIVLVSVHFFASDECCRFMDHALQRHQTGMVKVIPLVVRSVSWRESPLGALAGLSPNDIPVKMWGDEDEGWHACVLGLQQLLGISLTQIPHTPRSKPDYSDRGKFLRLLRRDYQRDLDESLERLVWQELDLHEQPSAVLTHFSQRRPDQSERALPAGTSILQVYDEAAEMLLILGEPGAGKSTLLTDLGLHLVARAETNPAHPLPVILPFSSWAAGQPALGEWLVEQLASRYSVPRYLGKMWVQQHQILPLLDGLDEMEEKARIQCIVAINTYRKATFSSLVVCSRTSEYQAASVRHRLALQQAVIVQPLKPEHILQTVCQGGSVLAALGEALTESEELRDLARTPLMLSILMLTYRGTTIPELPQQSLTLEQQIWQHYMERMIREKGGERQGGGEALMKRYDPERTRSWLGWLAQQMRQHNQTVFSGEALQESWLPLPLLPKATRLVGMLPIILLGGAASLFLSFVLVGRSDAASLCQAGLVGGFLGWCLRSGTRKSGRCQPQWRQTLYIQARRFLCAGCLALLYASCFGLDLNNDSVSFYDVSNWIHDGIINTVLFLVSGWLLQVLFSRRVSFSAVTDALPTSRRKRFFHWWHTASVRQTGWTIVILGLTYGLNFGLNFELNFKLNYALSNVLGYALSFGVAIFLLRTTLDRRSTMLRLAEQISWTWRALLHLRHLRASLLIIFFLGCFFGLSNGLGIGLVNGVRTGLSYGLIIGLSNGLIYGLIYGLSYGLSYWLLLGLYQGMTQKYLEDRDRRRFNQGLHRSLCNSLLLSILGGGLLVGVGLLSVGLTEELSFVMRYGLIAVGLNMGLLQGLSIGLSSALDHGLNVGLNNALNYGLSVGWLLFLCGWFVLWATMGGLTILRHYTLRVLLAGSHTFPLNARRFLDDAVARGLLKRSGGGYAFMHRRLLDYCADIAGKSAETEKKA